MSPVLPPSLINMEGGGEGGCRRGRQRGRNGREDKERRKLCPFNDYFSN